MKQKIKKVLKISGISILSLLALMFLLPVLFPDKVASQIKQWANQSIEGELNFSKARLSFFKHFPSLTLSLYDYSLKGSAPYKQDTLIAGKELSFGINLLSLFKESIVIDKFYVDRSLINIQVDKEGQANYNIYKADTTTATADKDGGGAQLKIAGIFITNSQLVYNDRSLTMLIKADGLHYDGRADLENEQFDLESDIDIDSVDFVYDKVYYVKRKHVHADLITGINTASLAITLEKNSLHINQLPVDVEGDMLILDDGYNINLNAVSGVTDFANVFTAIPPEYNQWSASTKFTGTSQVTLSLKGGYRAATNQWPHLNMHMWVKDGSVNYNNAPHPLEHFYIAADLQMPSLNPDSTVLTIDSLKFMLKGAPTRASIQTKGITNPYVKANISSQLDLEELDRALGLNDMVLKGALNLQVHTDGVYNEAKKLFPPTEASIQLKNGTIQTPYYPQPVEQIEINTAVHGKSGTYEDLVIDMKPVSFSFEQQPFQLQARLQNLNNVAYDITAKGTLDLTKIYQVFAVDGYKVTGLLKADLDLHGTQADATAGRYQQLQNNGTLEVKDLKLYSSDFPHPFEIPQGTLRVEREKAWLKNTLLRYLSNAFTLNGYATNFIGYYLQGSELTGNLRVSSPKIVVDEFMELAPTDSISASADTAAATSVVMIPANLNLQLDADAKEVLYNGTTIKNFDGSLQLQQGALLLPKTRFEVAGARTQMSGSYKPTHTQSAEFTANFKADSFDVRKAYNEIPLFREMASAAKDAEGLVSLDYALAGKLNAAMSPVYPSIKGKGVLKLENVKLKGMKLFGAVSKASGKDSLNNPNLKAVVIKSSIANNILTIERTKMKVFGFRPRVEGQVSLDGKLNLKFRLGLPPFGLIGIPMSVTGTSDKPIVKMRRGKDGELLKEELEEEEEEATEQ